MGENRGPGARHRVGASSAESKEEREQRHDSGKPGTKLGLGGCGDYDPIKVRALYIVQNNLSDIAPDYTTVIELCRPDNAYALKAVVAAALCQARDELRSRCFKVGQHLRAQRELCRELREIARYSRVRVKPNQLH